MINLHLEWREVLWWMQGGMDKLADYLAHHWNDIPKGRSINDTCRAIVGILFDYDNNKDKP